MIDGSWTSASWMASIVWLVLGALPGSWTVMPTNALLLGRSRRLADRVYPTQPNSRNVGR
jgi:hypothetical protein